MAQAAFAGAASYAQRYAMRTDGLFRSKPLAASFVIGGLAWLAVGARHPASETAAAPDAYDAFPASPPAPGALRQAADFAREGTRSVGHAAAAARDEIRDGMSRAARALSKTAARGKDDVLEAAQAMREKSAESERSARGFLKEHPVAAGSAAVALGAIIGAAILVRRAKRPPDDEDNFVLLSAGLSPRNRALRLGGAARPFRWSPRPLSRR